MTATLDLAAAFAAVGLDWPSTAPGWIGDVLAGAAGALGLGDHEAREAAARLALPAASRVAVVLIDGLGATNLAERAGHAPFLRRLSPGAAVLTSTFPSTTATAIGSFGTGAPPGRTGMLGYTVRVPATGTLGNLVSWTGLPEPQVWQPEETWFERLRRGGVRVASVGPARFDGSGLTRAALRGADYLPADGLAHRVDAAVESLRRPGLTYLYWGDVDKVGHHQGWQSHAWGDQLAAVDAELARLAWSVRRGTLLLVTADHGMLDADPAQRWDVPGTPDLARDVALVSGEPRAMLLHLEPGADVHAVVGRWRAVLGDAAVVVPRAQAQAAGLFGTVHPRVEPVLGDVVVAMAGRATVVDSRTQTPASLQLIGVHGSLTRHETAVPLLVDVA